MNNSKNYKEDGGDTIVLGGDVKITSTANIIIEEGTNIKGLSTFKEIDNFEDSTADTVKALKNDFNLLLSKLREVGLLKV
jgi:uncharacterized Zn ribbon protein